MRRDSTPISADSALSDPSLADSSAADPPIAQPFALTPGHPSARRSPDVRRAAVLAGEIQRLAALIAAGTHELLTTIRAFDQEEGWKHHACSDCAHFLQWRIGPDRRTAREYVRVATALEALPEIDSAFAAGEIGYSKVQALTRVASPQADKVLASVGRLMNGAQLEKACRMVRAKRAESERDTQRAVDEAVAAQESAIDRSVSMRRIGGGRTRVSFEVWEDDRAMVETAITLGLRAMRQPAKSAEERGSDIAIALEDPETLTFSGSAEPAATISPSVPTPDAMVRFRTSLTPEYEEVVGGIEMAHGATEKTHGVSEKGHRGKGRPRGA